MGNEPCLTVAVVGTETVGCHGSLQQL